MTTILHINSSAQLSERSNTRQLGSSFLSEWHTLETNYKLIDRDVGKDPVPPIDQDFIAAAFTKPDERTLEMKERLRVSDLLIDEVIAADIILMGVPMYNYGMPAALKGWIDQVARIGRTFSFDLSRGDFPIEPMLKGKTLVILSSRGEFGFEKGGMREHINALDVGVTACAHYFGVRQEDIYTATIEYQEFKDDRHNKSVIDAHSKTREIARLLAETFRPGLRESSY